jgi:hypothetical protein
MLTLIRSLELVRFHNKTGKTGTTFGVKLNVTSQDKQNASEYSSYSKIENMWNVCSPTLFRFLEKDFADAFFTDGSLRLSSFARFKKHSDEQRLDINEGKTFFVHRTEEGGGQTITAWATHGLNSYVLSTAMRFDHELMEAFECDSYIRINNPTKFGMAIAQKIPGLISAFEGPCLYQSKKIIEKDLGYIDPKNFKAPNNEDLDKRLTNYILQKMEHYPLFLKEKSYSHQMEYRFVWIIEGPTYDYLDIKVPEAIQFCSKPSELSE